MSTGQAEHFEQTTTWLLPRPFDKLCQPRPVLVFIAFMFRSLRIERLSSKVSILEAPRGCKFFCPFLCSICLRMLVSAARFCALCQHSQERTRAEQEVHHRLLQWQGIQMKTILHAQ
eukprot:4873142-Amphidinium_carterae.1